MRLITDRVFFEEVLAKAQISEKADAACAVGSMDVLRFESMELLTLAFFELIQRLMARSGDDASYYLTLDPDPVGYFAAEFAAYPLVELTPGDSAEDYVAVLNAEIGGGRTNSLGTSWWKYIIMPRSGRWFIVGVRDFGNDVNGHIWCPRSWTQWVIEHYQAAVRE